MAQIPSYHNHEYVDMIIDSAKSQNLENSCSTAVKIDVKAWMDESSILNELNSLLKVEYKFKVFKVTNHSRNTIVKVMFPYIDAAIQFVKKVNNIDNRNKYSACVLIMEDLEDMFRMYVVRQCELFETEYITYVQLYKEHTEELECELHEEKTVPLEEAATLLADKELLKCTIAECKSHEIEFKAFHEEWQQKINNIPSLYMTMVMPKLTKYYMTEVDKFKAELPIYRKRSEILEIVSNNQVSIILGETGSGKSTQLTQYLYSAGYTRNGPIVCNQPRKIAATSLAKRVAEEMHVDLGNTVGYKVGQRIKACHSTEIYYMTDHMLLKECLIDSNLTKYSAIIIHEPHERSLYTDLLLGMIKRALLGRPTLKVVVTSATIDPDIFVSYFDGAPVLKVSWRMFPVEIVYNFGSLSPDDNIVAASALKAVSIAESEDSGDILVFVTTPVETEKACERTLQIWQKKYPNESKAIACIAHHGNSPAEDHEQLFAPTPHGRRKIVFATNSAETSITIPGIRYVIDTGLAKEKLYDAKKNMGVLKVTQVSKSSAKQRMGRAGRVSNGKCYRLYTEETYETMEQSSKPEILREHLGTALLQLFAHQMDDPLLFDFVEMPPKDALMNAYDSLVSLGALKQNKLTVLGRQLSKMPMDPRLGKLLLSGIKSGIVEKVLLVACFSMMGGNMFYRGASEDQREIADRQKIKFCHPLGDTHTMLSVYEEWESLPTNNQAAWGRANCINSKVMQMTKKTKDDLIRILKHDLGISVLTPSKRAASSEVLDKKLAHLLLENYHMNVCIYSGSDQLGYIVVNDPSKLLHLHPGSSLKAFGKLPELLVFETTITTSRDFMINAIKVTDENVNSLKDIQIKRSLKRAIEWSKQLSVVQQYKVFTFGPSTLAYICGPNFTTLRDIQDAARERLNTKLLVLDINKQLCTLTLLTAPEVQKEVIKYITKILIGKQISLENETLEIHLHASSPTRVVIAQGGEVNDILFSREFRSIQVGRIDTKTDDSEIVNYFSQYGAIVHVESKRNDSSKLVTITFDKQISATKASGDTGSKWGEISVCRHTNDNWVHSTVPKSMAQLKLMWCRRETFGDAFITFSDRSEGCEHTYARELCKTISAIYIEGMKNEIKCDDDGIKLFNIPQDITFNKLMSSIKSAIQRAINIPQDDIEIRVPRRKVDETGDEELEWYKTFIEKHIEGRMPGLSHSIFMKEPGPKSTDFTAFINVEDYPTCFKLMKALTGVTISRKAVDIIPVLKSTLTVQNSIYSLVQDNVDNIIKELQKCDHEDGVNVFVKAKDKFDVQIINMRASSLQGISSVRKSIQSAIEGSQLNLEDKVLAYFVSKKGRAFCESIDNKCQVKTVIRRYRKHMMIYGGTMNKEEAVSGITDQIEYLEDLAVEVINLKEYPPGIMKMLMKSYGTELEILQDCTAVDIVELNVRQHILNIQGTGASVDKVRDIVDASAKKLHQQIGVKKPGQKQDQVTICSICFCEIEVSKCRRLEMCGHTSCRECLSSMFQYACKAKEFPIVCPMEGCERKVIVRDIQVVFGNDKIQWQEFIGSSTECYLATQQGHQIKYCPTPDCDMIYRETEDMNSEICCKCYSEICTKCHNPRHPEMTCEHYRMMNNMGSKDFDNWVEDEWLKGDRKQRALCPNCHYGIEKNGGCKHVNCFKCKAHICWQCKKHFSSSEETYNHLSDCGGIFE